MMIERAEQVQVNLGTRTYTVYIAPGLLTGTESPAGTLLSRHVQDRKVLLVADSHLASLYGDRILAQLKAAGAVSADIYIFPAGEEAKTFVTVEAICRKAAQCGLDRQSMLFSLGGGVTSDMAGFAASIYMRGIDFISLPTSLLAMIDAGIGGKTGADLPEGKNLIGTFWQPKAVLMDVAMLKTLPISEMRCGCAELIKHAILFDPDLFQLLTETVDSLLNLTDLTQTAHQVARSCRLKAAVVSDDERESGRRALLNFGHSFGHAMEKLRNFTMPHGDAVSIGMVMACTLSVNLHIMKAEEAAKCKELLKAFGLPVSCQGLSPADILEAMRGDKKNRNGKRRLVLPRSIGRADVMEDIPEDFILTAIGANCD